MKRSEIATKFLTIPTGENQRAFKMKRNLCNRLHKKERKKYFKNKDLCKIADNEKIWKTVKPFLSNKEIASEKNILKRGRGNYN